VAPFDEDEAMSEIVFLVEDAPEGGFTARARGAAIFTEADDLADLSQRVREAVAVHFTDDLGPKLIRLHHVRDTLLAV
jgi:hypothetical protein